MITCQINMTDTVDYYRKNAREYFEQTLDVDMRPLRDRFLAAIPSGGKILDAGCGSGRDARVFIELGHDVTAFDASPELARLAGEYLNRPVETLRFQEMSWNREFDGIWACASLLHVPTGELPGVLGRMRDALKPGGVLYASFKYGRGIHNRDGRQFTNLDEAGLDDLLEDSQSFSLLDSWLSEDRRSERASEYWFNFLLKAEA